MGSFSPVSFGRKNKNICREIRPAFFVGLPNPIRRLELFGGKMIRLRKQTGFKEDSE